MRRVISALLACLSLLLPATAVAGPVATSDEAYTAFGRVFPDPHGGACANAGIGPCSPHAQGNVPAVSFLGFGEFEQALTYMNQRDEWRRYMEVWPLDTGKFPGNNLARLEFEPDPSYVSAGLPTTGLGRQKHKLYVVRVTDETVPDAGKKRYALSLSIHGIERAGVEGGVRAMEDIVTAATANRLEQPVLGAKDLGVPVPTFGDVLKESIIYFTFMNPDGWKRGSISEGGVHFQRYNGNGVDLNRDFPDIGYAFRPYSSMSEPETRAFVNFFLQAQEKGGRFAAGDDLHGQITADSFSYTLMPHGSHDFAKNGRILAASRSIHAVQQDVLSWSPLIQPDDDEPVRCDPAGEGVCATMYGQTFGTVYDTINYTITGAVGDFFDSSIGLNADGIDNEMSFSHIAPDIIFDPHIEQLHVDGNVGLIYAHLAEILGSREVGWRARGRKGVVPNPRVAGEGREPRAAPEGTRPQEPVRQTITGTPDRIVAEFPVEEDADTFNGGMRVEVTQPNVQGNQPAALVHSLDVQCQGCDEHPGVPETDEWITVAEDFNQSGAYTQAGLVATVNYPQAFKRGEKVKWRVVVDNAGGPAAALEVTFTRGPASRTGNTGGGAAPYQKAYNVASTDFWTALNRYAPRGNQIEEVDPARPLPPLDTLVLSDHVPVAPGFTDRVKAFVEGGGNLVLTDGALRALPSLFAAIKASHVKEQKQYLGQLAFTKEDYDGQDPAFSGSTVNDPLAKGVAMPGARFNSGLRRQTYEPVPIGFQIQDATGEDEANAPQWFVDRAAFEQAGGRVAAVGVEPGASTALSPVTSTVTLGELPLGQGVVRIVGALLPQPTQKFDHNEGLEPHAVTYTGYELAQNLVDHCRPGNARCGEPFGQSLPDRDRLTPVSRVNRRSTRASRRSLVLRGVSRDRAPRGFRPRLRRVEVAVGLRSGSRCRFLRGVRRGRALFGPRVSCLRTKYVRARGTRRWTLRVRGDMPRGRYVAWVRGVDALGNVERKAKSRNMVRFRIR